MKLKIAFFAKKDYQLVQKRYRELSLEVEKYEKFYDEKMKLLTPVLEIINKNLKDAIVSIDSHGNIQTQLSREAQVKNISQILYC